MKATLWTKNFPFHSMIHIDNRHGFAEPHVRIFIILLHIFFINVTLNGIGGGEL